MFCGNRAIFCQTTEQSVNTKTTRQDVGSFLKGLLALISQLGSRLSVVSSRLKIGSPQSSTGRVCESEEDASNRDKLQQSRNSTKARVCALSLLNPLVLTGLVHSLELEVSGVSSGPSALALEEDEHDGTDDGDEVERQVHDVSDDGTGCELCEWLLDEFAETANGITTTTDLALLGDELSLALSDQSTVERVNQALLNEERLGQGVEDGTALVQTQQSGVDCGKRAIEDGEDGGLREVAEDKDTGEGADAEQEGRSI